MSSKDRLDLETLFGRIAKLKIRAIIFNGTIVRSVATKFANEYDFLSGTGAEKAGGRWNPPGIRTVYASLDILTATHEAYQNFLDLGFSLSSIQPRVTAGARTKLRMVLDLTDPSIRRKLHFTLKDWVNEDWEAIQKRKRESWTQAIGRGAREADFEALLVPSARRRNGKNIVIFPDRLRSGSILNLLGGDDLPHHPSAWPL